MSEQRAARGTLDFDELSRVVTRNIARFVLSRYAARRSVLYGVGCGIFSDCSTAARAFFVTAELAFFGCFSASNAMWPRIDCISSIRLMRHTPCLGGHPRGAIRHLRACTRTRFPPTSPFPDPSSLRHAATPVGLAAGGGGRSGRGPGGGVGESGINRAGVDGHALASEDRAAA